MVAKKEPFLTAGEVAELLNVHINTIRRWSNMGLLKSYRLGPRGDRRFRMEDVMAFVTSGEMVTAGVGEDEGNNHQR
jgi:excisionase family DNA binding protein